MTSVLVRTIFIFVAAMSAGFTTVFFASIFVVLGVDVEVLVQLHRGDLHHSCFPHEDHLYIPSSSHPHRGSAEDQLHEEFGPRRGQSENTAAKPWK